MNSFFTCLLSFDFRGVIVVVHLCTSESEIHCVANRASCSLFLKQLQKTIYSCSLLFHYCTVEDTCHNSDAGSREHRGNSIDITSQSNVTEVRCLPRNGKN